MTSTTSPTPEPNREPKHPRPDRYQPCEDCKKRTGQVNWYDVRDRIWKYFCDRCW